MITIEMGNVISKISGANDNIDQLLTQTLRYTTSGFGTPETIHNLYNCETNMLYTGIVPRAIQIFQKMQIPYIIKDLRIKPESTMNFKINNKFSSRDYQGEIIYNATTREIIQAATGAGKTFIMASLIAKRSIVPTVVIAPKISLALQIKKEFEKFLNVPIGIIGGGLKQQENITVCTPKSIPDSLVENCKMILFDEVHNLPANTIFKIASKAKNAYYRYGVSATPWRDDGKDLLIEAALNIRKPHLSITASKLIEKGKLTPCTINMININSNVKWQGSYDSTYDCAIVNNGERNNKIIEIANHCWKDGHSTLVLIKKIKHGELLLSKLKENIMHKEKSYYDKEFEKWHIVGNVEFLSGEDDLSKRNAVLESVKDGFTKILIGSTIADEGLDLPILDRLILAGAGKSSTRAFQRVGRVLRLYEGKSEAIVYDFMDSYKTFLRQAILRKALYETEALWKIK